MNSARVRLPADVELEDKLAFGLSARQLLLLVVAAIVSYGVFVTLAGLVPAPVAVALAAPVLFVGVGLALGRRDGLSADRLALAAARYLALPRRRILAPEHIQLLQTLPQSVGKLAPLDLPIRRVRRSGLVELTDGSACVLLRAASATFALRSDDEQEALVEAFGRFLNGLTAPVEIVVHSEPVDLHAAGAELLDAAAAIENDALRQAANSYARFLTELGGADEVRRREILLVLTAPAGERTDAQTMLERRAADAVELLRPAGIELKLLDGVQAAALLARTLDPPGPPAGSQLSGVIRRS